MNNSTNSLKSEIVDAMYVLKEFTATDLMQYIKIFAGSTIEKQQIIEDLLMNQPLPNLRICFGHFFVE